ncbi:HNH endonuclease family protein [Prescottella subtropica]|uniref:HNH endonuclease family protein n=1 Tax=Prescottella subtropica TaxID=2545757 RepID=UPI003BA990FA
MFRRTATAIAASTALLTGCTSIPSDGTVTVTNDAITPAAATAPAWDLTATEVTQTMALLNSLPVKGRAPKTGYSRDQFGPAWTDNVDVQFGNNSCDTRNDILKRDLSNITFKDSKRCVVQKGTLVDDPYTGKTINFVRGKNTSSAIQIEHIVSLSNSWQTGAQQLSERQRRNFANDPRNLIAVDGPANMAKGDGDAATWLPANKSYRCTYVSAQVQVKAAYNLWVTRAEKDAIARVLDTCTNSQVSGSATGSLGR